MNTSIDVRVTSPMDAMRAHFFELSDTACSLLKADEFLTCELVAEDTQFVRFNRARVRQTGHVTDAAMALRLMKRSTHGLHVATCRFALSHPAEDASRVREAIQRLRDDVALLPPDPFAVLPENHGSVDDHARGMLAHPTAVFDDVMPVLHGIDLAGIYASGTMVRATANSVGQRQWFSTENFSFDYSLYTAAEKAVKRTFAGTHWVASQFAADVEHARALLAALERPPIQLPRGSHRAYLAPAAVFDLIGMFSWDAVGERAIQKGESPLRTMRHGDRQLSSLFSLCEDFSLGLAPRFTGEGHVSPTVVPIVERGKLVGSLVHARTAREFGVVGNGAASHEGLRSPSMGAGTLRRDDVLQALDTGVLLSNLHYLNWSDAFEGRITGMTRYACLWVEHGEVKGPIDTMRWDDSLFRLFGSELLAVGDEAVLLPEVSSYGNRQPGGMRVPGMLVGSMQFTL